MGDTVTPQVTSNGLARPTARNRILSVRLSDAEYGALEQQAWSSGQTIGDWARDQLLKRMEQAAEHAEADRLTVHVFTELIGLQMLLMAFFSPLLEGRQISTEQYQELVRSVQAGKGKRAKELLAQRLAKETK
jgi:hypothetical protein